MWDRELEDHEHKVRRVFMVKSQHLTHDRIDRVFEDEFNENKPADQIEREIEQAIQVKETAVEESKAILEDAQTEKDKAEMSRRLLHNWVEANPDYVTVKELRMLMDQFATADNISISLTISKRKGVWGKPKLKLSHIEGD
jgi:hypothetical protein